MNLTQCILNIVPVAPAEMTKMDIARRLIGDCQQSRTTPPSVDSITFTLDQLVIQGKLQRPADGYSVPQPEAKVHAAEPAEHAAKPAERKDAAKKADSSKSQTSAPAVKKIE